MFPHEEEVSRSRRHLIFIGHSRCVDVSMRVNRALFNLNCYNSLDEPVRLKYFKMIQ